MLPNEAPGPGSGESAAGGDPDVLAERRARRAEHAEGELRARLAGAERRLAEAEHAVHEAAVLRERLARHAERDRRLADVVGRVGAALGIAREALDREIAAREATEAALAAERAARHAAEQVVAAERAARDALGVALAAARMREAAAGSAPVTPEPPGVPEVRLPASLAPAPAAPAQGTEQLIAGLALAAERLRAQAPAEAVGAAPAAEAAPPAPGPAGTPPSAPGAPAPAPAPARGGGLLGRLERALRNLR